MRSMYIYVWWAIADNIQVISAGALINYEMFRSGRHLMMDRVLSDTYSVKYVNTIIMCVCVTLMVETKHTKNDFIED